MREGRRLDQPRGEARLRSSIADDQIRRSLPRTFGEVDGRRQGRRVRMRVIDADQLAISALQRRSRSDYRRLRYEEMVVRRGGGVRNGDVALNVTESAAPHAAQHATDLIRGGLPRLSLEGGAQRQRQAQP